MGFISLFASISAGLRAGFFMVTIQKFNIRVRNTLFKSITSQEIGFFDDVKTGNGVMADDYQSLGCRFPERLLNCTVLLF